MVVEKEEEVEHAHENSEEAVQACAQSNNHQTRYKGDGSSLALALITASRMAHRYVTRPPIFVGGPRSLVIDPRGYLCSRFWVIVRQWGPMCTRDKRRATTVGH